MSHNAIRVSIRSSCNIWLFISAILRISKEGKRPNIEVLNLNKEMLLKVIYGHYCMEGREEFMLMCKFSPKSVVHLCINRISHFGVTPFSSFYHDVLYFSPRPRDRQKPIPVFFLSIYFNLHYMFRRSGPGHMLLLTVQNKIVQDQISLSLAKVKVKFGTKGHTWRSSKGKSWAPPGPLRSLPTYPSPPSSSWPLLAE